MARYWPKQTIEITEPCHEDWDAMTGDARVRHCASCDQDVHNTAALTPRQIEALLAERESETGSLPCLRLAKFSDGSLLVAQEAISGPRFGSWAGAAMAALVTISVASAAGQSSGRTQITMGRKPVAQAVYSGQVVGADGKPAPGSYVYVSRTVGGKAERVEVRADAHGSFRLQATPGEWKVGAIGTNGPFFAQEQAVTLRGGEQGAAKPLLLEPVTVTAGIPLPPQRLKPKEQKPGK